MVAEWLQGPGRRECRYCGKDAVYLPGWGYYVHLDASGHEGCWDRAEQLAALDYRYPPEVMFPDLYPGRGADR